ncbi:MAG TPA: sulfite exporter TauE/SafE family protein [Candidatus Tripitaka californicus]|uniref:sulfite exporter TauE/SafE family protein n=1 Tax=Candidatus Tripitaka californicus TaxID=3367616 RepID=UPI0040282E55
MEALILSAIGVGLVHSLAPDHWLPFASLAQAQGWSRKKLLVVSFLAGLGHVGSSFVLGVLGIVLGMGLAHMEGVESFRGNVAGFLRIGFGVAYALWGLQHIRDHHLHFHEPSDIRLRRTGLHKGEIVTFWTLMAIFVFGPCEPLIPLMFLAVQHGWSGIWLTTTAFSVTTVFMVMAQSMLAFMGLSLLPQRSLEKWSHVMAGGVIALTGLAVMFLGI